MRCDARKEACPYYDPKPEGVAAELADCVLRILDTLAAEGTMEDVDGILSSLPRAAQRDFCETLCELHSLLASSCSFGHLGDRSNRDLYLIHAIGTILAWAEANDVDMEAVLRAKHEYNKTGMEAGFDD